MEPRKTRKTRKEGKAGRGRGPGGGTDRAGLGEAATTGMAGNPQERSVSFRVFRASPPPRLRVAAFEPRSLVNGPGVRAVLWVQGCGRRCPGCFNPDFLSREGGRVVSVSEVLGWVGAAMISPEPIEGVTFSGGEPFDQAEALAAVAKAVHERGLGVMIFTGHPWADLEAGTEPGWADLIAASDLLVAGPYERGIAGTHPLLTSGNQELVHVTERYRDRAMPGGRRRAEFRVGSDGNVRVSGFPAGMQSALARWREPAEGQISKGL